MALAYSRLKGIVAKVSEQQMQGSNKGQLLQTRFRTLDGTLHDLLATWYPVMPANDVQPTSLAAAA
jgi:hypothetical protein